MSLHKDASDVTMVWFYNICNYGSGWEGFDTMFYGVVSEDKKSITIPFGQKSEYVYSNGNAVTLNGFDGSIRTTSGNCVATIDQSSGKVVIDFGTEWGFMAYINDAGYIAAVLPGIKAVKK